VPRSIRGRITLGSVAIAAVVLVALALLLGEQLRRVAGEAVAAMATDDLRSYAADLTKQPDELPDQPDAGVQVLVLSPRGTRVIDSMPVSMASVVERSGSGVHRLHQGNASYVAVGERVTNADGVWRLWSLRETTTADAAVRSFTTIVLIAVPIILLVVAVGSWLLVSAALRPVHRLRSAAERISRSDEHARLPESGARDELAGLTETLNRFLLTQREGLDRERRMVADASHELRTPLAVLTTQLELARRRSGDAAALEAAVVAAQTNVAALSHLATQLLELSTLEADPWRSETSSVGALLSELMAAVDRARAIAPPGLLIELETGDRLDEDRLVRITPLAFGRIVDNLATNAVHATDSGEMRLRIDQADDELRLTVTDSGPGFPPDFLPHAFDRFARSEASRAAGPTGSGIGLALVEGLAHAAGGRVAVGNRPEGGAQALVRLPLVA